MTTDTAAEIITRTAFVEGVLIGVAVAVDPAVIRVASIEEARDVLETIREIVRKEAGMIPNPK